jgi:hypothetical protein
MVGRRLSGIATTPDIALPIGEIFYWQGILALVEEQKHTHNHSQ